jgi:hypothetical protein
MMKIEDKGWFWNSDEIEMVKLGGEWYALDGWNGEIYADCYKYHDRTGHDRADGMTYTITPVYGEYEEVGSGFPVLGYEIN